MYILNEKTYIEQLLESNEKPLELSISYLISLLSKYYINNNAGDIFSAVANKLNEMNISGYQEYRYAKKIKEICSNNMENPQYKIIDYIPIYQDEIDMIATLPSDRHKKLMFTIIVIARYMNCGGWINKKDIKGLTEVYKMANIRSSFKNCNALVHDLMKLDYVKLARANDNLNIRYVYESNKEQVAYKLTDFTNVGNQYIGAFKTGWKQCKCCGKKIKISSNRIQYCTECAKEINKQKTKNNMKILRNA